MIVLRKLFSDSKENNKKDLNNKKIAMASLGAGVGIGLGSNVAGTLINNSTLDKNINRADDIKLKAVKFYNNRTNKEMDSAKFKLDQALDKIDKSDFKFNKINEKDLKTALKNKFIEEYNTESKEISDKFIKNFQKIEKRVNKAKEVASNLHKRRKGVINKGSLALGVGSALGTAILLKNKKKDDNSKK